jgi:type I restriction enzyme, S subunit
MTADWAEVTVESIASRIAMGPFGSDIKTDNFVPDGVPVVRGGNLTRGRFHAEDFVFLDEQKADELSNANAVPGDLVFTHRGTLGQVGLIPEALFPRYVVSQSQLKVTCNLDRADPLFVYYFFKSPAGQHALLMNTSQTGVPAISRPVTSIKAIRLRLPPLSEQRAIAGILGALDDKIELNQRMSETLEAMGRALFKSWFVDFDPVRAKVGGRDSVLPQRIADLFPDRFEDSDVGDIPAGWRWSRLADCVNLLSGHTPPKDRPEFWGGDTPWISPKSMRAIHADEAEEQLTQAAFDVGSRVAPALSTLVMVRGMGLHKKVRVSQARQPVAFNQDVKALVPRDIEPTILLFALLAAQPVLLERVESSGHGTGRLPTDRLAGYEIALPPADLQGALALQLDAINDRIAISRAESRTLQRVRDGLLPKLTSGEIRVAGPALMREATLA